MKNKEGEKRKRRSLVKLSLDRTFRHCVCMYYVRTHALSKMELATGGQAVTKDDGNETAEKIESSIHVI